MRFLILVDQPRPHPLAELRMTTAVEAQGVFHLKDLSQGHVAGAGDLLPHQMSGHGRTFTHGFSRATEQQVGVVALQADGFPGAGHVTDIQQFVDLLATWQPLGFGHLRDRLLLQGLEQTVELHGRLLLPIQLQQAFEQLFLLFIEQETVRQVQIDRIATVHLGAGQAEKQAELAGQP
ncbi:hypothetical protein D3C87_1529010 [compost metagenome]